MFCIIVVVAILETTTFTTYTLLAASVHLGYLSIKSIVVYNRIINYYRIFYQ